MGEVRRRVEQRLVGKHAVDDAGVGHHRHRDTLGRERPLDGAGTLGALSPRPSIGRVNTLASSTTSSAHAAPKAPADWVANAFVQSRRRR